MSKVFIASMLRTMKIIELFPENQLGRPRLRSFRSVSGARKNWHLKRLRVLGRTPVLMFPSTNR
jgi:hypothetical protein